MREKAKMTTRACCRQNISKKKGLSNALNRIAVSETKEMEMLV